MFGHGSGQLYGLMIDWNKCVSKDYGSINCLNKGLGKDYYLNNCSSKDYDG